MKRRFFNFAALMSLLTGLVAGSLWTRSVWWVSDAFLYETPSQSIMAISGSGMIILGIGDSRGNPALLKRDANLSDWAVCRTVWFPPVTLDVAGGHVFISITDWLV